MNTMKFYREDPSGTVHFVKVRVNQSQGWRRVARMTPARAMDLAATNGFRCRRAFGEKRLARAKREGRLVYLKRKVEQ